MHIKHTVHNTTTIIVTCKVMTCEQQSWGVVCVHIYRMSLSTLQASILQTSSLHSRVPSIPSRSLIFFFFRFFFRNFFGPIFFQIFWTRKKIFFFSELRFFFGYSFDVKFSDLSIYDVFRAFGVRQIWFPAPTRYCEGTKTCSISRVFWILVRNRPFSPLWKCRYLEIKEY